METVDEIGSFIDGDAAAFARGVWDTLWQFRRPSLVGFDDFGHVLVTFGAFAAHRQGIAHPDMANRETRTAFEVQAWIGDLLADPGQG
jgi:hypothetical protein